jgi:hypothetical protein
VKTDDQLDLQALHSDGTIADWLAGNVVVVVPTSPLPTTIVTSQHFYLRRIVGELHRWQVGLCRAVQHLRHWKIA